MFNGYHEPPGTAYNDLEADRGKKKWPCGNGTSIQSTHIHPQNHQSPEIWCSKSPYIGLPNSVNTVPKCNCPSCYQLPENQSYQGDITWHRSWLSRTYPAPVSQDLVKLQANHHWENACLPAEAYGENAGPHYVQESADRSLFYKSYPELRHPELYQPAVISSLKTPKIARKEDFPKQDESELGHHRFPAPIPNPGCGPFRNAMDRRRLEEESVYSNQNEKYLSVEPSRQQKTPGPYHLHPSRRGMLDSFSKTVPSTTNQNRVPSVGHHNVKDNVFHSYIDQSNIGKMSSYNANQAVTKDKHCRSLYQLDVTKELNPGQENLRTGLLNTFSPAPVDYHSIGFNRDFQNTLEFQKYMNSRNPQYLPRNNICDVIFRNCQNFVVDTRKEYSAGRKGMINANLSGPRPPQAPPKYMDVGLPKSPTYGKLNPRDCSVSGRVSSDVKLVINPNGKESFESFQKADGVVHGHFARAHSEGGEPYPTEKAYNPLPLDNPVYKSSRRPEHPYRDIQLPYDQPNGMMNLKNNTSVGISQEQIPNFADIHASMEAYNRVNNNLAYDGSCQQYEKLYDQISGENKVQASAFASHQASPNFFEEPKKVKPSEKEDSVKISHLESIRYEELCKNGTSKISPLRLLRKKKFTQPKKEDAVDAPTQDAGANPKNATSPIDVRRFWATWAEEEEDNVPQTQMVVLDCHNIDPEQAGLLHLYNPEPIRTIHLDEGSLLDVKSSQYGSQCEQNLTPFKTLNFDNAGGEKVGDGAKTDIEDDKFKDEAGKLLEETKYLTGSDLSFGMTLVMDSAKEAGVNTPDTKLSATASENVEPNGEVQTFKEDVKQFDIFKYCEKDSERVLEDSHTSIKDTIPEHVTGCEDSEIGSVLTRDDAGAEAPSENGVKESIVDDFGSESHVREEDTETKTKEPSTCSDSSDDSQTGDMSTLSNLPTSEYRKNKFLDYTGDISCNGSFSLKGGDGQDASKEGVDVETAKADSELGEKLESPDAVPKSSEVGPNDFEIEEILQKLSDINVQSPGTTGKGVELTSDVTQKSKTDKRIIDRKQRRTKKLSHKSSRTDQLAVQSVSPNKSRVKFSIQKSHDLKISLKVLNNSIKCEDNDSSEVLKEVFERGSSYEDAGEGETGEEPRKDEGEVTPLKAKDLDEESEKNREDEDEARMCRKFLKKKKIRPNRSPSPKTPVLKIKKNRYMLNGSEREDNADTRTPEDLPKSGEGDGQSHGDFQVHESVDSAKIKLTFKRNKNGNGKKSDSPEMVDVNNEDVCSGYSLVTDLALGGGISSNDNSNDVEAFVSPAQNGKNEAPVNQSRLDDMDYLNSPKPQSDFEELKDESSKIEDESLTTAMDSSEVPPRSHDNFPNESEKEDSQLSLPVINAFGCGNAEHEENPKDYLPNSPANQISETNVLDNEDLPDYQDAVISIDEGECINCDKVSEVGQDERNKMESRPSEMLDEGSGGIRENKECISELDRAIKVESTVADGDMEYDADEKFATEDIDMEVSFIKSIETLANGGLLKTELEVDCVHDAKPPLTPKNIAEDNAFERENFGSVKDDEANEPESAEYKAIAESDVTEEDTKAMWQNLSDTGVECCEVKQRSDSSEPVKDLSERKIADDMMSVDFPADQSDKDTEFEIGIEDNIAIGSPKQKRSERFSDFGTGTENMFEILREDGEDEKRSASDNKSDTENSRAADDGIIDRGAEDEVVSTESNRENVLDIGHTNKTPIQQDIPIAPVGISHVSQYLQVTDDNNNNNTTVNTNNGNDIDDISGINSDHRRLQKENAFLTRTISRRCSCEDRNKEQKRKTDGLRYRSKSLNISITCPECDDKVGAKVTDVILKVPVLDIPVCEIPLPPGDAPPGNCFNLEEYYKCKALNKDGKSETDGERRTSPPAVDSLVTKDEVDSSSSEPKHEFQFLLQSQSPRDLLPDKGLEELSMSAESPDPKENNEHKFFDAFRVNNREGPDVSAENGRAKEEDTPVDFLSEIVSTGKSSRERTPEVPEDFCGLKLPHDCPEYSGNDSETLCARDVDLDLGESSFRTDALYECDGLAFDEGLAIADDMEEEKVSDDDKFRNIMQNCLDNAKKFLSEGNLKLFPCARDDFLEIDCFEDQTQDKKPDHISKDVLLASCEKSCSDDLVLIDHHFSDISADFVPSFCSDAGSNLCPEILPVDNWPYLEEEVTSSPIKNKPDDPDLLGSCIENTFRMETSPLGHWNLLNDTDSEYVDQRLKNKSRAVSVCVTEGPTLFKTTEKSVVQRRRTIEGIGRWKSFHNSNEELTINDDIQPIDLPDGKYRSSPKKELPENARHSKSRDASHEKLKKRDRDNTEVSGKTQACPEVRSEKPKLKSSRNSIDFKSSLWQPKVVLFRISKKMIKDLSTVPKRGAESDSSHKPQTEESKKVWNKDEHVPKHETDDSNRSSKSNKPARNDREHSGHKTPRSELRGSVDRVRESPTEGAKKKSRSEREPSEDSANEAKRKKSRFRNLYTKKRIVPDAHDVTKDKSATGNSSSLVDSEESSPERCPRKQAAYSQSKSSRPASVAKSDESHRKTDASAHHSKPKAEEEEDDEGCKAKRRYKDATTHRRKSSDTDVSRHSSKRKRESYESEHEMGSQRKKERNHARENERTSSGETGGRRASESAGDEKSKRGESTGDSVHSSRSRDKSSKHRDWKCEVCGFSKSSERAVHIQSHPFHCQSCHLAFKAEANFLDHLTRKHKDIRNQHHCLLCELSFDLEKDYYRHLETREHRHLETVEKNTINTLFTLLTGHPCPVLGHFESKPEWLPTQAGTVHFYHQATPLSLALQYLKLHRDKTSTLSTQIE